MCGPKREAPITRRVEEVRDLYPHLASPCKGEAFRRIPLPGREGLGEGRRLGEHGFGSMITIRRVGIVTT